MTPGTATVVPPPELRHRRSAHGESFSFRWVGVWHSACLAVAIVGAVLTAAVARAVREDPHDAGMVVTLVSLALAELTICWATAAGLLNRTTITFEADCVWVRHGPVAIVYRGRFYGRHELLRFEVQQTNPTTPHEWDDDPRATPSYVLRASMRGRSSIRLTRDVTSHYDPALRFLAAYGNEWLAATSAGGGGAAAGANRVDAVARGDVYARS